MYYKQHELSFLLVISVTYYNTTSVLSIETCIYCWCQLTSILMPLEMIQNNICDSTQKWFFFFFFGNLVTSISQNLFSGISIHRIIIFFCINKAMICLLIYKPIKFDWVRFISKKNNWIIFKMKVIRFIEFLCVFIYI